MNNYQQETTTTLRRRGYALYNKHKTSHQPDFQQLEKHTPVFITPLFCGINHNA